MWFEELSASEISYTYETDNAGTTEYKCVKEIMIFTDDTNTQKAGLLRKIATSSNAQENNACLKDIYL